MQLKAGSPLWLDTDVSCNASPLGSGPLSTHAKCDVAIVGGGITGAMAAEHLARAGVDVVAIDRRPACHGSTLASTGLIQYELDTSLLELIAKRGESEAFAAYRQCVDAVRCFPSYLQGVGVQESIQPRESLYAAVTPMEGKAFQQEYEARRACGIELGLLSQGELKERFQINRPMALWSPGALAIDPFHVSRQIWLHALQLGARLHTPVQVTRYDAEDTCVTLSTDTGYTLRARHVIFATGYETPIFLDLPVKLNHTYVLASQADVQGDGWNPQCLIWESARPYLYVRSGPDGRAIVGGSDQPWSREGMQPASLHAHCRKLQEKFAQLLPGVALSPEYVWAGVFAETSDGLPFIGPAREFPRGYFTLGYGGNGILFSFIAAQIIRDLFLGEKCDATALFRLDR